MSRSTSNAKSTLDKLAEQSPKTTKARYEEQKANGVVNPIVLAQLLRVRPQMIYNYLRKGKFGAEVVGSNNTQKKVIDLEQANAFAQKYLDGKADREAKQAAKVEAELAGETVDA